MEENDEYIRVVHEEMRKRGINRIGLLLDNGQSGFCNGRAVDASVLSKNRFSVLEVDDGAVDHANNCDPIFTHIGPKVDNTVISKETEKGKASEGKKKFIRTGRVDVPEVLIEIKTVDTGECVSVKVLLDSGVTECFIDEEFAKKNGLYMTPMCHPAKISM